MSWKIARLGWFGEGWAAASRTGCQVFQLAGVKVKSAPPATVMAGFPLCLLVATLTSP